MLNIDSDGWQALSMAEGFTDEDTGKSVVTAEGDRVGTISEVNDGRATVKSNEDDQKNITDHIRDILNWDESGDPQELDGAQIDRNDDDEVVLPLPGVSG